MKILSYILNLLRGDAEGQIEYRMMPDGEIKLMPMHREGEREHYERFCDALGQEQLDEYGQQLDEDIWIPDE